jgi:hypothetical protein
MKMHVPHATNIISKSNRLVTEAGPNCDERASNKSSTYASTSTDTFTSASTFPSARSTLWHHLAGLYSRCQ